MTGQAPAEDSEVILHPKAVFADPFRRSFNVLVMCDSYTPAGDPIRTNKRYEAAKIFSHHEIVYEQPWLRAKVYFVQKDTESSLGGPQGSDPPLLTHKDALSLGAPHTISTLCVGVSAGDELWVARYILERITEIAGVVLSFFPKPLIHSDWNVAGAKTKYSTRSMNEDGGYEEIEKAIVKLGSKRNYHIELALKSYQCSFSK
ncbi:hypothetical protein CASFOL_027430 [Castilleja foliolosa]|uniref:Glutamine synthetase n=1 Tax=Castilleja foliolosa TaxID=1961234 RepID=A0ABD3CGH6_9LAMI